MNQMLGRVCLLTVLFLFEFVSLLIDVVQLSFHLVVVPSLRKSHRQVQRGWDETIVYPLITILFFPSQQRKKHLPKTPSHISHFPLPDGKCSCYPVLTGGTDAVQV